MTGTSCAYPLLSFGTYCNGCLPYQPDFITYCELSWRITLHLAIRLHCNWPVIGIRPAQLFGSDLTSAIGVSDRQKSARSGLSTPAHPIPLR